jgi:hypothetical protein
MPPPIGAHTVEKTKPPFPLPGRLPPDLARVHAYWRGLLRGAAEMPFADDVKLTDLPDLGDRLFLIDVFDQPERFRFAAVGKDLATELGGKFLDETALSGPLSFLRSQASATTEAAEPTFFRHDGNRSSYGRLLAPLWADGRIAMLLGAVAFD